MAVLLLIIGLILFVALVVLHEFGHFIMARQHGVEVEEFGIGFPPKLWKKRVKSAKGDYNFTINLLPLGGFVKLKGENDSNKAKGSFGAASLPAKVKIMVAGVVMNLLTALVLLTLLALVGMPKLLDNQFTIKSDTTVVRQETIVAYVEPNSPAEHAGIKTRDQLWTLSNQAGTDCKGCSVEGQKFGVTPEEVTDFTRSHPGQKVFIEVGTLGEDNGKRKLEVQLRSAEEVNASKKTDNPKGYLGLSPTTYSVQRSTWSAPIVGAGLIGQFTAATFNGLGSAVSGLFHGNAAKASEQVAGPVGIFVLLKDGSALGYQFILMIIAVISLTLAIMNVLPIPALDGGRLFVTLIFRLFKKPLTKQTEERIHGTGFALLIMLFLLITVVDIKRFF